MSEQNKENDRKKRVLWLDDHVDDYKEYIKALRVRGFTISTAADLGSALQKAQRADFDLFLIDLRMKPASGFQAIKELRQLAERTTICVLSSYLASKQYVARVKALDNNIAIMDKIIPDPDRPEFEGFVARIRSIIDDPPKSTPGEYLKAVNSRYEDPFKIEYHNFLELPALVRRRITRKAREAVLEVMQEHFDEGHVWVLFCGSPHSPAMTAASEADIPTTSQILDFASKTGFAPYQFSAPTLSDDMWHGACEGNGPAKGYPTVTLELGRRPRRNEKHTVHFDTGTSNSFMDFRILDDLGLIARSELPTTGKRGASLYEYVLTPLKVRVYDQVTNGNKIVSMNVRAVFDWDDCPFRGTCSRSCKNFSPGNLRMCKNRSGLIGRNLILDNKIKITLDGKNGKTMIPGTGRGRAQ